MHAVKSLLLAALAVSGLGCSATPPLPQAGEPRAAACCQAEEERFVVGAKGHGAVSAQSGASLEQRKLLAIRAAKMDAYRNLAERLQGFRLSSGSSLVAGTVQGDQVQASLESHLRGARVISVVPLADGIYETLVEIELIGQPAGLVAELSPASSMASALVAELPAKK